MMKKMKALLCVVLALCLLPILSVVAEDAAPAGVTFVEAAPDASTVLAKVNDTELTYADLELWFQDLSAYYSNMGYDVSGEDIQAQLKSLALYTAIQQEVVSQKATEWGLDQISDEEKAEMEAAAAAEWAEIVAEYEQAEYGISDESTDEEKETARLGVLSELEAYGYTESSYIASVLENAVMERVQAKVSEGITVTDEDIQAAFDAMVAEDKAQFENNVSNYEFATMYFGQESHWIPEGYRGVTHILLTPDEALMTAYTDLVARLEEQEQAAQAAATSEEEAADEGEEDVIELTLDSEEDEDSPLLSTDGVEEIIEAVESAGGTEGEEADADEEEPEEAEPEATEVPAEPVTQEQVDAAAQAIMDSLQPTIDEIMAKFNSGVPFADLIVEYGQDPGMTAEPNKSQGYSVHKDSIMWDPVFTQAAFSIDEIGKVSEPVLGSYGVHIVYYLRDVPAGAVELTDDMKASLYEE